MAENEFKTSKIHATFKDYSDEVVRPHEHVITVEKVGFRTTLKLHFCPH